MPALRQHGDGREEGDTLSRLRKLAEKLAGACARSARSPLWQEARDRGSQPKPGYTSSPKNPRYRLDEYLKRRYRDRVYLLIWDEVHEAQHGDTGNGEAFSRMAGMAQKVLAMTGTPFNGRSSSIFNIEYALNPRVRQRYAWGGRHALIAQDARQSPASGHRR